MKGERIWAHPPLSLGSIRRNGLPADLLTFRAAKSAHEIDDEADQQNQAKPATADDGTTKVKSTAAEQEQQDNNE
jgi:hypothetical protein